MSPTKFLSQFIQMAFSAISDDTPILLERRNVLSNNNMDFKLNCYRRFNTTVAYFRDSVLHCIDADCCDTKSSNCET